MSDDFLVFLVSCDMYTSFCPVPASGSSTTVRQAQVTNDEVWHRNFESLGITCFFSAWITGKYIHVKSYKYSMAKVNRRDQISGYRCLEARTPFMYYIYIYIKVNVLWLLVPLPSWSNPLFVFNWFCFHKPFQASTEFGPAPRLFSSPSSKSTSLLHKHCMWQAWAIEEDRMEKLGCSDRLINWWIIEINL